MQDLIPAASVEAYRQLMALNLESHKPEVADWFIKTAYDAAWAYQQKRFPKETPEYKKLFKK